MSNQEIILFTRYPQPGKVKTRLVPQLGETEAVRIHSLLTRRTVKIARQASRENGAVLTVCYTGGTSGKMRQWLGDDIQMVRQRGRNLGRRMAGAFQDAWDRGTRSAILIGSDCADLDAPLLEKALKLVRHRDLVLGPAADGGYYLIGLHAAMEKKKAAALFEHISWGTAAPFDQTVERARKMDLAIATIKELHDIDRPEDLTYLGHYPHPE